MHPKFLDTKYIWIQNLIGQPFFEPSFFGNSFLYQHFLCLIYFNTFFFDQREGIARKKIVWGEEGGRTTSTLQNNKLVSFEGFPFIMFQNATFNSNNKYSGTITNASLSD